MAKIRSLKAEFFRDEDISAGGLIVKTLAAGLICCLADDEGRFKASPGTIRGEVFTHDDVSEEQIVNALNYLHKVRWLVIYGRPLSRTGAILNWTRHQFVPHSRFTPSRLPPPPNTRGRRHGASMAQADRKHDAAGIGKDKDRNRIGIGKDPSAEAQTAYGLEKAGERFAQLAQRLRVVS